MHVIQFYKYHILHNDGHLSNNHSKHYNPHKNSQPAFSYTSYNINEFLLQIHKNYTLSRKNLWIDFFIGKINFIMIKMTWMIFFTTFKTKGTKFFIVHTFCKHTLILLYPRHFFYQSIFT